MMRAPKPDTFIARIAGRSGATVGVGALVGPRHIITCAHVVNAALGVDPHAQDMPTDVIGIDFPLLPGTLSSGQPPSYTATVAKWLPPAREGMIGLDLAGLILDDESLPPAHIPARLAVDVPLAGSRVRVFGYPGTPPRPVGAFVESIVRGRVGPGGSLVQLDSGSDSALRVQPGFSGSPVYDDASGRVLGLIAWAPGGQAAERDSYAIAADQIARAWPELLAPGRPGMPGEAPAGRSATRTQPALTILHLSDMQLGGQYLFGGLGQIGAGRAFGVLLRGLREDLSYLADEHGLRPDLMVVTGDLTASGLPDEFEQITGLLAALSEAAGIPRAHVAIVPGNHDVSMRACEAYFADQESEQRLPVPPYSRKWRQFQNSFDLFYQGTARFTPDQPYSLFEMPGLNVVVAGLNSTMAESHRPEDHYGSIGKEQLQWFAARLALYRDRGWLRIAAMHHHISRKLAGSAESLLDVESLDTFLGKPRLVNLLLHGHAVDVRVLDRPGDRASGVDGLPGKLASGLIALSTGSAPAGREKNPPPSQYQVITLTQSGITQYARRYDSSQNRWVGDNRVNRGGQTWRRRTFYQFNDAKVMKDRLREAEPSGLVFQEGQGNLQAPGRNAGPGSAENFFDRVLQATKARYPKSDLTVRDDAGYLRVSAPLPGGGAEQWPVGVVEGQLTETILGTFIDQVHGRFASADPSVRSEVVYGGPPVSGQLAALARRAGVRLRSFVEYQGLLDLRPLVERQDDRLASDRLYPAAMYVPQRYRLAGSVGEPGPEDIEIRDGLIDQAIDWLSTDNARFVMVLGDFGRGKTSFLRQLARTIPVRLPALLPVLVELRKLEKAPSLDGLLALHLVNDGVDDVNPAKLRYMISSGRLALLFDGFDELELRVGYDNAADYLQVLLESVNEQAKVVLTSRTQHFRSSGQIRTALGQQVATRAASRIAVLEDFSDAQVLRYLTSVYDGDGNRARARFTLLGEIHDLLGLARNPRMLAFIAGLDESRLRDIQHEYGRISAAELYREIITFWLTEEAGRQRYRRGLISFDERDRFDACTTLALRLWTSAAGVLDLAELSATVKQALGSLAERGYSTEQASHSIGSGSLLVRTDDGAFMFVHQSIMEWLVAEFVARELAETDSAQILATRPMSNLMADFFADLAGHAAVRRWASRVLADPRSPTAAKHNALAVLRRRSRQRQPEQRGSRRRLILAGIDLRGQDLTNLDLRGANLRGANLRDMHVSGADLSGADLSDADMRGCRLIGCFLRHAIVARSKWDGAALLGTEVSDELAASPELRAAAIAGRDPADLVTNPDASAVCVSFSPDGSLMAIGSPNLVKIINLADEHLIRVLHNYTGVVSCLALSPGGLCLASASGDSTAQIWDTSTGTVRITLRGHEGTVRAIAFSPDGTLLATASADGTARIWDTADGTTRITLRGHVGTVRGVAFSADGTLLATASGDGTARIWDTTTGLTRLALHSAGTGPGGVAFSPDDALLVTAGRYAAEIWDTTTGTSRLTLRNENNSALNSMTLSPDGTLLAAACNGVARIWDTTTGTSIRTIQGHGHRLNGVALSPGGSLMATACDDGTARIWDTATGVTRRTLRHRSRRGAVRAVAFSPYGTLVATASDDRTARIWDTTTGTSIRTLQGHDGTVRSVAFSPDGALVATAAGDCTARIWDARTAKTQTVMASLDSNGYAAIGRNGYKIRGNPSGALWWAIRLCRFEAGELDSYVPSLTRLRHEEPLQSG